MSRTRSIPFRFPWLVRLGEWSFAFYLVHELVLRVAGNTADLEAWAPVTAVVGVLGLFALALAASAAMHHLIERPAMVRLR